MKKLQCPECKLTFWMQFREEEEGLIQTGEWIGIECPQCENPWAAAAPMRARRGRKKRVGGRAGGRKRKASMPAQRKAASPARRGRKPRARKGASAQPGEVTG